MSDFLAQMAIASGERADAIRRPFRDADFDLPVASLQLAAFDMIAEIKDRSPSAGPLTDRPGRHAERALEYVKGGAAAISVLTEPSHFGGSVAHLEDVVRAVTGTGIPVMCKDFLVDRKQVLEARAAGASGVLLIVAMLADRQLAELLACAREHSMFVLLESFDENDLARIRALLAAGDDGLLAGVNVRDLRTLAVDNGRLEALAAFLPGRAVCVAESGLAVAEDAAAAARLGYRMGLVGTALMRSANPAALLSDMLQAGRAGAGPR